MATVDDLATEHEERFLNRSMQMQAERAAAERLRPSGECLVCGDPELPEGSQFFCCVECRDDFEKRQKAKRIAGRV